MAVAKNSLTAQSKETTVVEKKNKTIFDIIQAGAKQFATALPKHINTDRFVRIAITTIRQNPKLAQCSQESLLGALMVSAQLGLEPGTLGQCYLIPYGRECQFQIGYKGMIELLRRSGQLKDIYAYSVYENDDFEITYGLDRNLIHKPNLANKGNFLGCYCVAILKDGAKAFEYMTKKEIEAHAKKFSKTFGNGPWKTDFEAMSHKTVVKKMLKWLPLSVEFLENIEKDDKSFKVADTKNAEDIEIIESDGDIINAETGEFIEEPKDNGKDTDKVVEGLFPNNQ